VTAGSARDEHTLVVTDGGRSRPERLGVLTTVVRAEDKIGATG